MEVAEESDRSGGVCAAIAVTVEKATEGVAGCVAVGASCSAAEPVQHGKDSILQQQQKHFGEDEKNADMMVKDPIVLQPVQSDANVGRDDVESESVPVSTVDNGNNSFDCPDSSDNGLVNGKKKRHRRRHKGGKHHRKWKPYDKLTWDERQTQDERETRRACKKRESRFASGQAMAPYNTTQFLMEQHEPAESELHLNQVHAHVSGHRNSEPDVPTRDAVSGGSGDGSSEEYCDSNEEEEIFLEKDFSEAYEQFHVERLQSMTKQELVKEHMDLECEVETLKRQVRDKEFEQDQQALKRRSLPTTPDDNMDNMAKTLKDSPFKADSLSSPGSFSVVMELQKQIKKLKHENSRLSGENGQLKAQGINNIKYDDMDTGGS